MCNMYDITNVCIHAPARLPCQIVSKYTHVELMRSCTPTNGKEATRFTKLFADTEVGSSTLSISNHMATLASGYLSKQFYWLPQT